VLVLPPRLPARPRWPAGFLRPRSAAIVALAALVLSPLPALAPAAAADPKPNVVLILTDDQRWDTIGRCLNGFDGTVLATNSDSCMPFLQQRLIDSGTTFTRGYVTTSQCCPSRAAILTGQYGRHNGVLVNQGFPNFVDTNTLATWLDEAGYRTGLMGKYLNGYGEVNGGTPTNYVPPGWDSWHAFWGVPTQTQYSLVEKDPGAAAVTNSYSGTTTAPTPCAPNTVYLTDRLCRKALDFLQADTTSPFFLYWAPFSPHAPTVPPSRWAGTYSGVATPQYPNYNAAPSPNPPTVVPISPLSPQVLSQQTTRFRQSLEMNRAVDDAIEQFYQQLSADGRLSNTVFIFMSDNGFSFGEHRWTDKACAWEECHRVPFVVSCPTTVCPGAIPDQVDSTHIVLNIDLAPTIAAWAGTTPKLRVDGMNLAPLLGGGAPPWRDRFLIEDQQLLEAKGPYGILSTGSDGHVYKLIGYTKKPNDHELYDLTNDPWEVSNLWNVSAYSSIQANLTATMNDMKTAPVVSLSGPSGDITGDVALFSWTASQSSSIECRLDTASYQVCGSGTSGSILLTGLEPGAHTFDLRGVDPDNNVSATQTKSFNVLDEEDKTPPAAPTFTQTPLNPSGADVTFAFTAEEGATLSCSLDGSDPATCTSPISYTGLAAGDHTFSVFATDLSGNVGPAATYAWTVASAFVNPPTITQKPTNPTTSSSATFSFTGGPEAVGFRCSLDGAAFTDCTSPKTYTGLLKGAHTFKVRAVDANGNESSDTTWTWTIKRG
jgi:arylsulfatase A-like enzyme